MYKVISCPAGKKSEVLLLKDLKLETLQNYCGGMIEVLPISENERVLVVCNEEALLKDMSLNRVVYDEDNGNPLAVISGDFLLLRETEDENGELVFCDFEDEDMIKKYLTTYHYPERILKTQLGQIVAIPFDPTLKAKEYNKDTDEPLCEALDVLEDL
jgi:hypothetical protein